MGIIDFFAKKAEEAQRRAEEEKRKAEEQAAAEKKLREDMEMVDICTWPSIHFKMSEMHTLRGLGAYDAAIEKAQEVLDAIEKLYFPGEDGQKCIQETYACIARCIYNKADVEDIEALEEANRYFELSKPMTQDVISAVTALSTLRLLDISTDDEEYSSEKYALAQRIYCERKDELEDDEHIKLVFKSLIEEKLIGKICTQDKYGARELAEEMVRLSPSLIEEYNRFSQYF